jgi:hypothetical protein
VIIARCAQSPFAGLWQHSFDATDCAGGAIDRQALHE